MMSLSYSKLEPGTPSLTMTKGPKKKTKKETLAASSSSSSSAAAASPPKKAAKPKTTRATKAAKTTKAKTKAKATKATKAKTTAKPKGTTRKTRVVHAALVLPMGSNAEGSIQAYANDRVQIWYTPRTHSILVHTKRDRMEISFHPGNAGVLRK